MTGPSKRELDNRLDELRRITTASSDAEAYALLVGAASGNEMAAERWENVDEQRRDRVTETADRS